MLFKKKEKKTEAPKGPPADLIEILAACRSKFKKFDSDLITKAFYWCLEANKDKVRRSGAPAWTHPVAVAKIIIDELPLDDVSVACALLHDITYTGEVYSIKHIQSEFGSTIAEIVGGIAKIKHVENQNLHQFENYRKLILSMFTDVRIILIKLADRLHNMRTLEYLSEEYREKISLETLEVYAPFSNRFGLGKLKWELEDLAFKFLDPGMYEEIGRRLQLTRSQRQDYIKNFIEPFVKRLDANELMKKNNIKYKISGRPKHIYSIYNKMQIQEKDMDELYDLFAIRIIIDNDDSAYCFLAYGILTEIYKPVPTTFKNYISNPKQNGYQSLHTAVYGPDGRPVEVQLRTRKMHEVAERGFAAHFKYKRGLLPAQSILENKSLDEWIDTVRSIFERIGEENYQELIDKVNAENIIEEIYALTPNNEYITLPKRATPLDFAYAIHTDVGNSCIGAKINGKVQPLDYNLRSGDRVEILNSKNQRPQKEWLRMSVTQRARNAINKYLAEENARLAKHGKMMWNQLIVQAFDGITDSDAENIAQKFRLPSSDILFEKIAKSEIEISSIYNELKNDAKHVNNSGSWASRDNMLWAGFDKPISRFKGNLKDNPLSQKFATCCYPLEGDKIVGVVISDREMVIHRKECSRISEYLNHNQPTAFELEWQSIAQKNRISKLFITADETKTLINDITSLILNFPHTLIKSLSFENKDNTFRGFVSLNVDDRTQLEEIINKLSSLDGIKSVERYLE